MKRLRCSRPTITQGRSPPSATSKPAPGSMDRCLESLSFSQVVARRGHPLSQSAGARTVGETHMAKTISLPWDPAEHLETEEDMAAYLEAALEEGDPSLVSAALGDIARAKGMTQLAR